jgi:predicted MFS family arabinose efflux permease
MQTGERPHVALATRAFKMRDQGSSSRTYTLAVLTALVAFNHLDRQLVSILLEPIRAEFALSDVQLGLLTGLAFAALYTTLSIPAAVWAVRHSRSALVAAAAALWGGMTVLCGFAQSYWQMLVARLGVGIGEAGGMPPSQAMISDLYPPERRATAQGILSAGINVGVFLGFLFGGLVGQAFGWRAAFLAAGLLTVGLALLLRLSVTEPARTPDAGVPLQLTDPRALVRRTVREMWADRVARHICIGATLTATVGYGAVAWLSSYLVRSHGMSIAAIGVYLACVIGIGGALGTAAGAWLSDRLRARDVRWSLWLVALLFIATKPLSIAFYLTDDTALALTLFLLPGAIGAMFVGPSIGTLHERMSASLRPVVSAVFGLIVNFVGLGLGPLLVGAMSQWVFAAHGDGSLRYALIVMQAAGIWGGLHFYLAGRNLRPARAPGGAASDAARASG